MNIKSISLLSLLLFANANSISLDKKLDNAKTELNECRSQWELNCDSQQEAFDDAKREFLAIHREKRFQGIKAAEQYHHDSKTAIPFAFIKNYYRDQAWKKHKFTILESWGSGLIVEAFEEQGRYSFLNSDESATALCHKTLEDVMRKFPSCKSSYIEKMIGQGFIRSADQADIDTAKNNTKEIIKTQA